MYNTAPTSIVANNALITIAAFTNHKHNDFREIFSNAGATHKDLNYLYGFDVGFSILPIRVSNLTFRSSRICQIHIKFWPSSRSEYALTHEEIGSVKAAAGRTTPPIMTKNKMRRKW